MTRATLHEDFAETRKRLFSASQHIVAGFHKPELMEWRHLRLGHSVQIRSHHFTALLGELEKVPAAVLAGSSSRDLQVVVSGREGFANLEAGHTIGRRCCRSV